MVTCISKENKKTMKNILLIIIALVIPVGGLLAQSSEKQTLTIPLSNPGQRGQLEIDLVNGSIIVDEDLF